MLPRPGRRYVASGVEASKTIGRSGCGVVIEGVDRAKWVTISKIAIPLKGAAMAAEIAGVSDRLQMLVCAKNINHCINRILNK